MRGEFTAVYEKRGDWYIGYVEEITGVNTQGKTLAEVKENLKEALILILDANKELMEKSLKDHDVIREPLLVEVH